MENIIDLVNDNFEHLKEMVDSENYARIRDGGESLMADLPCDECGEEYICVDESFCEFGRCLNCGVIN